MEHLGSLANSKAFFVESASLLRPGGVSVHTTELLLSGLDTTVDWGHTVVWRYKDIKEVHDAMQGVPMGKFQVFPIDLHVGENQVIHNWAIRGRFLDPRGVIMTQFSFVMII